MQLRVWCAITGNCAAVLRAGLGGADKSANNETEPGGHRSGVVDVDFIDRGRNVIALDRGGWFRLWDISTQVRLWLIPRFHPLDCHLSYLCSATAARWNDLFKLPYR